MQSSTVQHVIQFKSEIMINNNVSVKGIKCAKNFSTCTCENSMYLKGIIDDSVIVCDEIINVTNSLSTNVTNTILTNVTSAVSINSDSKKARYKMDCYIHTISLVIISLFLLLVVISIGCYYCFTSHGSKQKSVLLY